MTRKKLTYDVLRKYVNVDNRIDEELLNNDLQLAYCNIECLYNSKYRKSTSLAWDSFVTITNERLVEFHGRGMRCNNQQLKAWLSDFGDGYASIKETVDYIEADKMERGNR